jgi:tetratricopeptide (TPR) repeat protein
MEGRFSSAGGRFGRRVLIVSLLFAGLCPSRSEAQRPQPTPLRRVTPTPQATPGPGQQTPGCDPVSEKRSVDRRMLYEIFQGLLESGHTQSSERALLQRLEEFRAVYRGSGLGPMHYLSSALVRVALQLRNQGREDVAQEFVKTALELWPGNVDAYDLSARLYLDSGVVGLPLAALAWVQGLVPHVTDLWRSLLLAHRLLIWVCVMAVAVLLVWLVTWTIAYFRLWCHDISEILSSLPTSVAYLIGALLPMAPLLLGQGVLWSVLVVLVLSWPYASRLEKWLMALIGLVLLGAPPIAQQASAALHIYDQPIAHILQYAEDGEEWNEMVWNDLSDLASRSRRDALPRFVLGNLYYQSHCYFDAVDQYQQAIAADRSMAPALNNLANTLYQQNNLDGAIVKYQQATRMDPDLCSAAINLSQVFHEKFEFQAGDRVHDQARSICPELLGHLVERDLSQLDRHEVVIHERVDLKTQLWEMYTANLQSLSPPLVEDLWPARLLGVEFNGLQPFAGGLLVAFLLRSTLMTLSRRTRYCLKCSRPTCPKCQLIQSSQLYCGQCVRLFILRSGIDAQVHREGVARTHRLQQNSLTRARMLNLVLPGVGQFLSGKRITGLLLLTAWAGVWALYLRPQLAVFSYLSVFFAPIQLLSSALILLAALLWALANLAIPIQE